MVTKELSHAAESMMVGAAIPAIAETLTPGLGAPVASILAPVVGLGLSAAGIGIMMNCI
jgi:hypothetical protein